MAPSITGKPAPIPPHQLLDPHVPTAQRIRLIFTLKGLGGLDSITTLGACLRSESSVLIKHEAGYALGQMGDDRAIKILIETLQDENEDAIVRHEAAEALGNLGDEDVVRILKGYVVEGECQEVRETCEIALEKLRWTLEGKGGEEREAEAVETRFTSVDPAPPAKCTSVEVLRDRLCDASLSLYERYRAMFSLRNINTEESVLALCKGMDTEKSSALFRHEVAYVLGQMQHEASIPTLVAHLRDTEEHEIVRHESAEAMGSIASPECIKVLQEYLKDSADVVRESCEVALDITDYLTSSEFSYTASSQPQPRAVN